MAFVELHARSAFSFLRASSSPEALTQRAAELGMGQIAVTDRDGVYGSARVHYRAKDVGLRGIVGAELTMEDESVLPVLARTREGYRNLCHLLTVAKLRAPKGMSRVGWTELENHAAGLMALSGDEEGALAKALAKEDRPSVLICRSSLPTACATRSLRGDFCWMPSPP
jgi:error-prone DNA polymerase